MSELKRVPVKYIRDYIKKNYKIKDFCYICNSIDNLELHHLYSISELFNNWCHSKDIIVHEITTVEEITTLRVEFEQEHREELSSDNSYTLCKWHHERLHNIYGQRYANYFANKVKNWLEIQRKKESD